MLFDYFLNVFGNEYNIQVMQYRNNENNESRFGSDGLNELINGAYFLPRNQSHCAIANVE